MVPVSQLCQVAQHNQHGSVALDSVPTSTDYVQRLLDSVGNAKTRSWFFPPEVQLLAIWFYILKGTGTQSSLSTGFIFSPRVHTDPLLEEYSKCNNFAYDRPVLRIQLLLMELPPVITMFKLGRGCLTGK